MTVVVLGLFAGCGVGPGGADGGDGGQLTASWPDGALVLGHNQHAGQGADLALFEPLPAEVLLTPGAQGGFHVEVIYRVTAQTVPGASFAHRVTKLDGGVLVSKGTRRFDVAPDAGADWQSEPFPVFMCPTPVGVSVLNEPVFFEITATSADGGLLGRTSGTTTIRCEAGQYCETICKG